MSFFVVPSVSYQTQQKLKGQKDQQKKKKSTKKPKRSASESTGSSDNASIISLATSSTQNSHKRNLHPHHVSSVSSDATSPSHSDASDERKSLSSAIAAKLKMSLSSESTGLKKHIEQTEPEHTANLRANSAYSLASNTSSTGQPFDRRNSSLSSSQSHGSGPNSPIPQMTGKPSAASRFSRKLSTTFSKSPTPSQYSQQNSQEQLSTPQGTSRSLPLVQSPQSSPMELPQSSGDTHASTFQYFPDGQKSIHPRDNHLIHSGPTLEGSSSLNTERLHSIISVLPDIFKPSYKNEFPQASAPHKVDIPRFKPCINKATLNSIESMESTLLTPSFQIFRFNNFLDILSDHHRTDPINFANVRHHSIQKFVARHGNSKNFKEKYETTQHYDIRFYESLLAYELLCAKTFLRKLIKNESQAMKKYPIANSEELLQVTLTKYVRYVISLPTDVDKTLLNKYELTHYEYKDLFNKIADSLYQLKKEESGESMNDHENNWTNKVTNLLQTITKVSYEYILLEKYHIHILTKFNNNSIIESMTLKKLFDKYKSNVKTGNPELLKVLFYNTIFSSQYVWFLCLTIPFVKVIELSIYTENEKLINDKELYEEVERGTIKKNFEASDKELFDSYTQKLYLNDFDEFREMTPQRLVQLHRLIDNQSPKYKHIKRHEVSDPSTTFSNKPMNLEYYNDSLSTFESNTFELIQTRDLALQVTAHNYRTVLREFHRILKPGGVLELPFLQLGSDEMKKYIEKRYESESFYQNEYLHLDELNLVKHFKLIPNFIEVMLPLLKTLFGEGNVSFSLVLLNSKDQVNDFLFKHISIALYEMVGKFDEYCSRFQDSEDTGSKVNNNESVHYYIHIKATKSQ